MRTVDVQSRKRDILLETIKEYIQSAVPVSSDVLKERRGFELSSATIRNVLAELEDDGFLVQPHTSSGRVPTDKGYRYYLELLLQKDILGSGQKQEVPLPINLEQSADLELVLERASDILAELTHYASIVSSVYRDDRLYFRGLHFLLEQPEFNDIVKMRAFLTVLEERARLLQLINNAPEGCINIYIGKESHCDEIEDCSLVISTYSRKGSAKGKLGILGPKRMDYSKVISILEHLSHRLSQVLDEL